MKWNLSYEGQPSQKDFGSVTAYELRSIRSEVQTRWDKEHTRTAANPPVCDHKEGECGVVVLADGAEPTRSSVIGAVGADYTNQVLYRDTGSAWELAATLDHESLDDLTDANCHSSYIPVAGGSGIMTDVTALQVTNLGASADPEDVMRNSDHDAGSDHDADVIDLIDSNFRLGVDKLRIVDDQEVNTLIAGLGSTTWTLARYCFMPITGSEQSSSTSFGLHPQFVGVAGAYPADYIPRFTIYNPALSNQRVHLTARRVYAP